MVKTRVNVEKYQKTSYYGDGVITAYGKVNGVTVYAAAQDCTISGGAGGEAHIKKICHVLELAIKTKSPFICLCDSGGARIEEGIISLSAYSRLFYLNVKASGYIPQIAAIMGNCAGGSSYSPALSDFVFMVKGTSQFFITGPKVIKAMTGEDITMEQLGGADIHKKESGQAHVIAENDNDCIDKIRDLVELIGNKKHQQYEGVGSEKKVRIEEIVPENTRKSYDVKKVIDEVVDENFFEILPDFARNIVVGFSRLGGKTIGIVANQPEQCGGALDCDAADKAARFVRLCDCFDIPLLVLVDVPGFLPGVSEERKGILRHGSKLLYAFAEAQVPKITLIMRKAYGGAYCAMNSKELGADMVFAWPLCEIAVMGADGAVDVIYHKRLEASDNVEAEREELIEEYREHYLTPYFAASLAVVDEIIKPEETRNKLIAAFEALEGKERALETKYHGNIPL